METEFFEFDQDEAELWGFGEGDGIPSCTPKSVVDEAFACIEGAKVSINPERESAAGHGWRCSRNPCRALRWIRFGFFS